MPEAPSAPAPLPRPWLLRVLELETAPDAGAEVAARAALQALVDAAASSPAPDTDSLSAYANRLRRGRPSSPLLPALLARFLAGLVEGQSPQSAQETALAELAEGRARLISAAESAFRPGLRALTLGDADLVRQLLLRYGDRLEAVVVSEGRPQNDGVKLALALADAALPARLVTEAQLELALGRSGIALASAERVLPDGRVVARVGTALLARLCAAHRIPFYVAAPQDYWVPERDLLAHFSPEQRSPTAVVPERVPGVEISNAPFDLTPSELVTGYFTEDGIRKPPPRTA